MISFIKNGDIFQADAQALVNPVNCAGTMGNGLALAFKKMFPNNEMFYRQECYQNRLDVGIVFGCQDRRYRGAFATPVWIINFPTKLHWKNPSQLHYIEYGVEAMKEFIAEKGLTSVAIPALGCGKGGLDWKEVKEILKERLSPVKNVNFLIYEPV